MSEHKDNIIETDTDQQIVDSEDVVVTYDENDTDNEDYHDSYESFVLSAKELESLVPQVPGTNNVHQIATEQAKEKIASIKNTILMQNDILRMYKTLNRDGSLKLSIETIEGRIKDLTVETEKEEQKLKNIANLKSEFKEKLPLPTFGTEDNINVETARMAIPCLGMDNSNKLYSPQINQGAVTLEEFWNKLSLFVEAEGLSEAATKKLFGILMFGEPYRAFFDNKDKPIKDILQILIDRFGSVHTIADKLKALDNMSRGDGEKIQGVMNRCNILVDATKYIVPENEREMRQNVLMTQNLLKLVKPKAKNAILMHRSSAARAGYNLSYKELLNIAIDAERLETGIEDTIYAAFPAVMNKKFRSHNDKPYKHLSFNKVDNVASKQPSNKSSFSQKPSISVSNPTTYGYKHIEKDDHIYQQPYHQPQPQYHQPKYQNYNDYHSEKNSYQNRYGKPNNQSTFVQRLDKNQLYQSIPMPFGCPKCGYGSENKQYNKYPYGNRYQKN